MTAPTHSGEITDLGSALAYVTASSNYCNTITGTFEAAQTQAESTVSDLQPQLAMLEAAQATLAGQGFGAGVTGPLAAVSQHFATLVNHMQQVHTLLADTQETTHAAQDGLGAAADVFRAQMGISEQVQSQQANGVAKNTAFYNQAAGNPGNQPTTGIPIMTDISQPEPTDDYDDDEQHEPEVYTTCLECDEPLEEPTTRYENAVHADCDPDKPPKYWRGALTPNGKEIDHNQAESYRRLKPLAEDTFDLVLEGETPYGDTFISLPDGSIVDAREWIERPENLELAGGRDQYAGVGEFDPSTPDRCWIGQTLPSGRISRPLARPYDDVAELAAHVCEEVFEHDRMVENARGERYTVMLPGGELVDAYEWAQRPETRRLAGYTPVEFDPQVPDRCWIGQTMPDGPVRKLATPYEKVADLAAEVCKEIFDEDRIHSRNPFTIMLPGGELVDAYDWAQRPETRRLAGRTTVRNRVQFTATASCNKCGTSTSCTAERIIQGEIGEQQMVGGVLSCDTCEEYLSAVPVPITLVDDASAAQDAPPRLIGDIE